MQPKNIGIWKFNIHTQPIKILISDRIGAKFWPPHEGILKNFEPKNDLKINKICMFMYKNPVLTISPTCFQPN